MKKLFVILAFSCFAAACGGGNTDTKADQKEESKEEAKAEAPVVETKDPDIQKGLELAGKSDCFTCHKIREQLVGPAYVAVSERYQNASDLTIDSLASKVITGGTGRWGQVPMSAHPQISKEDATAMVKYVLSLKKS
jgi:cytochrome c